MLASELEPPKVKDPPPKQPLLINYHDEMTRRLNHLKPVGNFDARDAELSMMGYLPVSRLNQFGKPSDKTAKERAARLQELLHFCTTGSLNPAGWCIIKRFVLKLFFLMKWDQLLRVILESSPFFIPNVL